MVVSFGTRESRDIVHINSLVANITVDEITINRPTSRDNLYNSNLETYNDVVCQFGFHIKLSADDYQLGQTVKGLKELRSLVEAYIKDLIPKAMTIISDEPKMVLNSNNCTCYCSEEEY